MGDTPQPSAAATASSHHEQDSFILELNDAGVVVYMSKAAQSVCGLKPSACILKPVTEIDPQAAPLFLEESKSLRTSSDTCRAITLELNGQRVQAQGARMLDSCLWLVSKATDSSKPVPGVPDFLVNTTGFAVDVFAAYLREISTFSVPPPSQELCRICERFVKTWWFARHHWFCSREHKVENTIAELRERVVDALARARASSHSVRVSSPLASRESSFPRRVPPLHALASKCEALLNFDAFAIRLSVDASDPQPIEILRELRDIRELRPKHADLSGGLKLLDELTAFLADELLLFTKFVIYRRKLAEQMEKSIFEAIDSALRLQEEVLFSEDEFHHRSSVEGMKIAANCHLCSDAFAPNINTGKRGSFIGPFNAPSESSLDPDMPHSESSTRPTSAGLLSASNSASNLASQVEGMGGPLHRTLSTTSTRSNHSIRSQRSVLSMRSACSCAETDAAPLPGISDYQIVELLSRGSYGQVYLARKRITGDLFAIKVLKKRTMVLRNQILNVRRERRVLMTTATSPYVATLHYSFQSAEFLYLVLEYVPGGDVATLLRDVGCLSEEWALQYIAEIVIAVESVHSCHFLHRDLKPENLLIDANGHLKLSDFGLSMAIGERCTHDGKVRGTPDYLAPESLANVELTSKADWWSVGCILFELVYGFPPFNDTSVSRIFSNIQHHRIAWPELPAEADVSAPVKDLISGLLVPNVDERFGSKDIRNHPVFATVDWDHVYDKPALYIPPSRPLPQEELHQFPADVEPVCTNGCDSSETLNSTLSALSLNSSHTNSVPSVSISSTASRKNSYHTPSNSNTHFAASPGTGSDTSNSGSNSVGNSPMRSPLRPGEIELDPGPSRHSSPSRVRKSWSSIDDDSSEFGNFSYRNLPVLEKANTEVIHKIKSATPESNLSPTSSPRSSQ